MKVGDVLEKPKTKMGMGAGLLCVYARLAWCQLTSVLMCVGTPVGCAHHSDYLPGDFSIDHPIHHIT